MADENTKFRVHHILCTQTYRGLGYNRTFCENMTAIVSALRRQPETTLFLVCRADAICQNCPNRRADDVCVNGKYPVSVKDKELLEQLQLQENTLYTYQELLAHSARYLTREAFERSCRHCCWFSLCQNEMPFT